jgi:hypothetical protein
MSAMCKGQQMHLDTDIIRQNFVQVSETVSQIFQGRTVEGTGKVHTKGGGEFVDAPKKKCNVLISLAVAIIQNISTSKSKWALWQLGDRHLTNAASQSSGNP